MNEGKLQESILCRSVCRIAAGSDGDKSGDQAAEGPQNCRQNENRAGEPVRSWAPQEYGRQANAGCAALSWPQVGTGYQLLWTDCSSGAESLFVTAVNTVEGTPLQVGKLAAVRAANALAAAGARPVGLLLTLTLPQTMEEPQLRRLMEEVDMSCEREDMRLLGGHTQVSTGVSRVIASVTGIGILQSQEQTISAGEPFTQGTARAHQAFGAARAGLEIVMTKWAGLSGSWLLEQKVHDAFVQKYNHVLADRLAQMDMYFSVRKEARIAVHSQAEVLFDLSESGVFGGLWEMASAGNCGLCVQLRQIPIRQETIELCDFADVNPYMLPALGSLLIATADGQRLVGRMQSEGIAAAVIGRFTQGNERVICCGDEIRYLNPPRGSCVSLYT